eukprot:TRINITY_DN8639_c0_g3_i2.p1 TRINITY_DN8639_c0_g3~~TRINITY_DN8639_c0_g3_i2.p1  ORF type:complete len:659 (+),score=132.82 TRINITY_DN8639_c0_g3_i2:132-1979(+)
MAAYQSGNLNKAAKLFKNVARGAPMIPQPRTNLAVIYEKQGKMKEARTELLSALKDFPTDHSVAITACRFGSTALNRKIYDALDQTQLTKACKRAHKLKPDDFESITLLGSAYVLMMKFKEAVKALEKAVDMAADGSNPEGHRQAMTNLALANLRGSQPLQALLVTNELSELYGDQPGMDSLIAGVRSIIIRYDKESVDKFKASLNEWARDFHLKDETCGSGKWNVAMNWTRVNHHNLAVKILNRDTALTTYGSPDLVVQRGSEPYEDMRTLFWERLLVDVTIHDAYLWSSNGIISMDCNMFAGSVSWDLELNTVAESEARFIQTVEIDDPVALTLPLKNLGNYYHWMCEGLLRAIWLQDRLDAPGNEDMKLVVPRLASYARESLTMLGFKSSQLLEYQMDVNVRWHFNKPVHLVDWIQPEHEPYGSLSEDTWSPYSPPRAGLQLARRRLQGALLEHDPDLFTKPWQVVYLSREVGQTTRSITNEQEIIDGLVEQFGKDRVTVHRGKESLAQQLAMFVKARLVVGAHGAGLSNTLVCRPNTAVVMLPMKPMVDMTFVHMAAALEHKMYTTTDVTSYYYGMYGTLTKAQIQQVLDTSKEAFAWTEGKWGDIRHDEL